MLISALDEINVYRNENGWEVEGYCDKSRFRLNCPNVELKLQGALHQPIEMEIIIHGTLVPDINSGGE